MLFFRAFRVFRVFRAFRVFPWLDPHTRSKRWLKPITGGFLSRVALHPTAGSSGDKIFLYRGLTATPPVAIAFYAGL